MTGGTVRVTRVLDASREAVFDAWTDPRQLQRWFHPVPGTVGEVSCDPVAGGRYRIVMLLAYGTYEMSGRYLVVDRPGRLVFTWTSAGVAGAETRVTVTLDPTTDGRTAMTIVHERLPAQAHDTLRTGWSGATGGLVRHLARR